MRSKVCIAAIPMLASLALGCGQLAAEPTRPRPHEAASKIVVQPAARQRLARKPAGKVAEPTKHAPAAVHRGVAPAHAILAANRPANVPIASSLSADQATVDRVHAWVAEQSRIASQDAIAAADKAPRDTVSANLAPARPDPAPGPEAPSTTSEPTSATAEYHETGVSRPPDDDEAAPRHGIAPREPAAESATQSQPLPPLKSIEEEAATPVILPSLYNQRGQLIMPPPLKGSHEILLHQNQVADRDGLDRIRDDEDLLGLRRAKKLVPIPESDTLRVDERLPGNRRFARPWTAKFLAAIARDHYAQFHTAIQVNSAVRTVEFQQRLIRTNGNAAPADGDTASPHLTGQAVDIAKRELTLAEVAWMRSYLLPLVQQGKIDVEEEFQQSCFHISVYKNYLPAAPPKTSVAATRHAGPAALATAIQ